jgi:acetyltransferase-like isoleucine patch superfamily enzyme
MIFSFLREIKQFLIKLKFSRKNKLNNVCTISKKVKLNNCELSFHSRVAEYSTLQHTTIGEYSSVGRYAKIVYTDIGKFCAISWDVTINAISHPYSNLSISSFPYVPYMGNFVSKRIQTHSEVKINNDAESEEMKVLQNAINQLLKNKFLMKTYSLSRGSLNLNNRFVV